jgi:hypothetical protein
MRKAFDCVAMKDDIQKRMRKQMKGLSCEQQRAAIRDALESSRSPIGELWRALESRAAGTASRVAEAGGVYGADGAATATRRTGGAHEGDRDRQ